MVPVQDCYGVLATQSKTKAITTLSNSFLLLLLFCSFLTKNK